MDFGDVTSQIEVWRLDAGILDQEGVPIFRLGAAHYRDTLMRWELERSVASRLVPSLLATHSVKAAVELVSDKASETVRAIYDDPNSRFLLDALAEAKIEAARLKSTQAERNWQRRSKPSSAKAAVMAAYFDTIVNAPAGVTHSARSRYAQVAKRMGLTLSVVRHTVENYGYVGPRELSRLALASQILAKLQGVPHSGLTLELATRCFEPAQT
ncbi:hypothetical protein [Pacificitalea manganoxidans]|uniref:hypothetical protein n=1 Tax=Pacificitalea manganoxidans TaxID=1411902 RepID=UPI0012FE2749|nr:hypothetical protein [Pacificitalea manganoxidans]MDR6308238.1 hypothetical protein [Pacificitalea manganoxidans]